MSAELLALATSLTEIEKGFADAVAGLNDDVLNLNLDLDLGEQFRTTQANQKLALSEQQKSEAKKQKHRNKAEAIMRSNLDFEPPARISNRV